MTRIRIVLSLSVILVAFGCNPEAAPGNGLPRDEGSAARPAPAKLQALPPGTYEQTVRFGKDDGKILRYTISIPPGYSGKKKVPLVLSLHYAGEVTPFFGKTLLTTLMEPAFKELGAILVAPDSLGGDWSTAENDQAVCFLLDSVAASYAVDLKKTVVTGYSMGGVGTWQFAANHPDRFAAAIPVAGAPTRTGSWRTPVYAVHSRNDTVIPLAPTTRRIKQLQAQGVNAKLMVLEKLAHDETARYVEPLREVVPWLKQVWQQGE